MLRSARPSKRHRNGETVKRMHWSDEALLLSVRPHGETSAIAELFTRSHGRHLGLVHGGRSRRLRPVLQMGNHVDATWKARLPDHLGHVSLELRRAYAAAAMERAETLAGLGSLCALVRLLPERDPHPELFEITLFVLTYFDDASVWPALLVRWELKLLDELGFGLDLETCALTGAKEKLAHVSPRSGRAVSLEAGAPYAEKLFSLPAFLTNDRRAPVSFTDVTNGLALTSHFIGSRILAPRGLRMPDARDRLPSLLARAERDLPSATVPSRDDGPPLGLPS